MLLVTKLPGLGWRPRNDQDVFGMSALRAKIISLLCLLPFDMPSLIGSKHDNSSAKQWSSIRLRGGFSASTEKGWLRSSFFERSHPFSVEWQI